MTDAYLIDTGFLVALLDARDPDHADCLAVWQTLRGRFVTVEGVLVETAHLLRRNRGAFAKAVGLLASVGAELSPSDAERYDRAVRLMAKYRDVPMDFVDALLVCIAEEQSISRVLTLDRRGFSAYRMHGRKRFELFPDA